MTEIDRLRALAAFASVLCSPMFDPGHWVAAKELGDGSIQIGYVCLSDKAESFERMAYDCSWVRPFAWGEWQNTERGLELLTSTAAVLTATAEELANILTTLIRKDRYCEGILLEAFENGVIAATVQRAEALLQDQAR